MQEGGYCQNLREVQMDCIGTRRLAGKNPFVLVILAWVPAFAEVATRRQVSSLFAKKK